MTCFQQKILFKKTKMSQHHNSIIKAVGLQNKFLQKKYKLVRLSCYKKQTVVKTGFFAIAIAIIVTSHDLKRTPNNACRFSVFCITTFCWALSVAKGYRSYQSVSAKIILTSVNLAFGSGKLLGRSLQRFWQNRNRQRRAK